MHPAGKPLKILELPLLRKNEQGRGVRPAKTVVQKGTEERLLELYSTKVTMAGTPEYEASFAIDTPG